MRTHSSCVLLCAGTVSVSDWVSSGRIKRSLTPAECKWGGLASLMSDKPKQKRHHNAFMGPALQDFRELSGYSQLERLAALVWGPRGQPASSNVILTGAEVPGRVNRSDPHQDEYHNLMLVSCGVKIWALAGLTPEEEDIGMRTLSHDLKDAMRLDATDRTRNTEDHEHEIARLFDTVVLRPGDVLFNPAWVWHQVNSAPMTLAYSLMYRPDEHG